jgi:type I restriction enzyme R subunit
VDFTDRPLAAKYQIDETREKEARKSFAKPGELPKILIVTDKLLTGYDAPVLHCMYLDKPMRDHVLLQAVARVNRPYEDEEKGKKKPCGLIIDFVGILRELSRAFSFDSKEVSGVIEDLDVLFERFRELMAEAERYLDAGAGSPDEQLYQIYFDEDRRRQFFEYFQEVETLYEILSPDAALRGYIAIYQQLADLYAALRSEYESRGGLPSYDLARKTEMLLSETVSIGEPGLARTVEYDASRRSVECSSVELARAWSR